ncbi:hypothetical protein [uncultured Nostoc sp.]|uniref:hypothetical protein n=1 Tax=uncultured Nostoc sp. TaxID=340711 RepID=UPI00260BCB32|nr:hypothetical protein [uncultured Nostoc sp.]
MPLNPSTAVAPHERLTFPLGKDFSPDRTCYERFIAHYKQCLLQTFPALTLEVCEVC